MKTLIINNHSKYIKELVSSFSDVVVVDKENLTEDFNTNDYNLIVVSGGSDIPTVLRHPEKYICEINIIKKSKIPVLGICLGAEIICVAYGGELEQLKEDHRGNIRLEIKDNKLKSILGSNEIDVRESHQNGIKILPINFIPCAFSEHGIEIFKHQEKPIIGFQFHPEISNNKKIFDWIFETFNLTNL